MEKRKYLWRIMLYSVILLAGCTNQIQLGTENFEKVKTKEREAITPILEKKKPIRILFFGDGMYDRQVRSKLTTETKLRERFSGRITLTSGVDFALFNLETPLVKTQKDCKKLEKEIAFCSEKTFATIMKEIGFNGVNIANNHMYDNRYIGIQKTIETLTGVGLHFFGNLKNYDLTGDNYARTGTIRCIPFVRLGYDFTVQQKYTGEYCGEISGYAHQGFLPLVSVHRGWEYHTTHNAFQEETAKSFIDCGAKLIVGHHPHVPQDIGWYNGVPIIYSLGNFLFDQGFSEATKKGMYALIDIPITGATKVSTGEVNAYWK